MCHSRARTYALGAYSAAPQTVSELFAIGAPSRPLVVPLMLTYDVLVIAFGVGVVGIGWWKARCARRGRPAGAYGVVGLVGPFAPNPPT